MGMPCDRSVTAASCLHISTSVISLFNRKTPCNAICQKPFQEDAVEDSDLRSIVEHLENLQSQQRSPQQPNPRLDSMILQLIGGQPERRQRMAIMTKSALLRKKILSLIPTGGRALGCGVLGATHEWRKTLPNCYSDCNWPKVAHNSFGVHHLPGGGAQHDRLLRSPSDKRTHHPLLPSSEFYSFPRARRFPGTHANGELNPEEVKKRAAWHLHEVRARWYCFHRGWWRDDHPRRQPYLSVEEGTGKTVCNIASVESLLMN
eukprot:g27878.t1